LLTLSEYEKEKAAKLLGVFKALGLKLNVGNFSDRLRTQKIVYMLSLHPELRPYLDYSYNMYLSGPYSPNLAYIYYNLPKDLVVKEVKVSSEAIKYGKEIAGMDNPFLEVAATLVEAMRINKNAIGREDLVEMVHELKPYYKRDYIAEVLEHVKELKHKYNLDFSG